ncbi:MAG: hypothetical protein WCV58_04275 [Patescibacteria group bacterium]|jgi:hypothetical protein
MELIIGIVVVVVALILASVASPVSAARRRKRMRNWVRDRHDTFYSWEDNIGKSRTGTKVYWLDVAGRLREEQLEDYLQYRFPTKDEPDRMIVTFGKQQVRESDLVFEEYLTLVYDPMIRNRWITDGSKPKSAEKWAINLIDPHGQFVELSASSMKSLIYTILRLVKENHCLDELERKCLRNEGVGILEESKSSMGKSQALGHLRETLEAGVDRLATGYIPDFSHLPIPR